MRDSDVGTLRAIDVNGYRLVIWTASEPQTAGAARSELDRIVASVQIEVIRTLPAAKERGVEP